MNKNKIWIGLIAGIILISSVLWVKGLDGMIDKVFVKQKPSKSQVGIFPSPNYTDYEMTINLDAMSRIMAGTSVIDTRNTTGGTLREILLTTYPNAFRSKQTTPAPDTAYYAGFDSGWLTVSLVTVNGKSAQYKDLGVTGKIVPDKPIKKNEKIRIEMVWKAKIPKAAYRYGYKDDAILLGQFYPILNVKDEKGWHTSGNYRFGDPFYMQCADYLVMFELPEFYQVAATGSITNCFAEDNGRQTMWIEAKNARDFAMTALYNYQTSSKLVNGIQIKCYSQENNEVSADVLERAAAAIKYYGVTYGSYPYPELNIIEAPMKGFNGMEYSGVIFLAEEVFSPLYEEKLRSTVIAHEVAHQWWYGLVGNDQINEPWLDEGLATWSANQYLKRVELRSTKSSSGKKKVQLGKSLSQMGSKQNYYDTAYQGGEAFWYGLETELGETEVLNILRLYLSKYRYRTATTEDLRKVITEESGQDLESFFDRWFEETKK